MGHLSAAPALAQHEAAIATARILRRQAMIMAFDDTIILQSALLGLALVGILFLKTEQASTTGEAH
jgi:DHA2 family multidrug resistance protein